MFSTTPTKDCWFPCRREGVEGYTDMPQWRLDELGVKYAPIGNYDSESDFDEDYEQGEDE